MAGLYEEFVNGSGKLHRAFTIVTADCRTGHADIRSRMPLLLGAGEAEEWLDPDRNIGGIWPRMLRAADAESWIVRADTVRLDRAAHG